MHAKPWRITRAKREDAFALAALTLQMDRADGGTPRPGFLDEYADAFLTHFDSLPTWIAKAPDGAALGYLQASVVRRLPALDRPATANLHVARLFVVPAARKQGLGAELLHQAQAYAREQGVSRVTLNSAEQARPLYRRVGFDRPGEGWMEWQP